MADELPGGVLSAISMKDEEFDSFIRYMEKVKPGFPYQIFFELMGAEQFFEMLDVFSNWRLNFPNKDSLIKGVGYVKVYEFCKARGFTEESKRRAAIVFNKKLVSIQRIVAHMRKELDHE